MDFSNLRNQANEVSALLDSQLRIRGKTLQRQLRKTGRLLPKRLKAQAVYLAHTYELSHNPKLARMIDIDRANKAHSNLVDYLKAIDPADRRKGALLGTLGIVSFNLIVVFIIIVAVLKWRNLI